MAEWGITPDYIVSNWTDELLNLMLEKLIERRKRESQVLKTGEEPTEVSEEAFLSAASNLIEVSHGK